VTPFLNKLPELEAGLHEKREGAEVRLLGAYQRIQTRIMLALTETAQTAGVVRCEQARASELADGLERVQEKRAHGNTLTAVIISGLTDVLTGALVASGAGTAVGVVGGVGGALQLPFAGMAIYSEDTYEFRHERNHLKDIWEGPASSELFPPSVWAFLNEPRQDGRSLRQRLLAKWEGKGRFRERNEQEERETQALLVSEGGPYTIANLRRRATFLEELAANIDLMHDDLQALISEVLVPTAPVL
jgi:hypothetical protein